MNNTLILNEGNLGFLSIGDIGFLEEGGEITSSEQREGQVSGKIRKGYVL